MAWLRLGTGMLAATAIAVIAGAGPAPDNVSGVLRAVVGGELLLQRRNGTLARVDATLAEASHRCAMLRLGHPITVFGTRDAHGMLHALSVVRAQSSQKLWLPDH